jgi:hypothetical protein
VKPTHTRRGFLAGLLALIPARALAVTGKKEPKVYRHTDPGSEDMVVIDNRDGQPLHLVRSVCPEEGWLEMLTWTEDTPWHRDPDGNYFRNIEWQWTRLTGDWSVRPRAKVPAGKAIFSHPYEPRSFWPRDASTKPNKHNGKNFLSERPNHPLNQGIGADHLTPFRLYSPGEIPREVAFKSLGIHPGPIG